MEMLGEGRPPPRSPPSRRPASLLVLHSVWKLSEGVWKQGFCLSFSVFADSMHKQLAPLLNSRQEGLSKCTGICRLIYTERTESRGRKQILPCIVNSLPGLAEAKHQNILTHSCFGKYFNIQSFYLYLIYQLTSNFWNTPGYTEATVQSTMSLTRTSTWASHSGWRSLSILQKHHSFSDLNKQTYNTVTAEPLLLKIANTTGLQSEDNFIQLDVRFLHILWGSSVCFSRSFDESECGATNVTLTCRFASSARCKVSVLRPIACTPKWNRHDHIYDPHLIHHVSTTKAKLLTEPSSRRRGRGSRCRSWGNGWMHKNTKMNKNAASAHTCLCNTLHAVMVNWFVNRKVRGD